MTLRPEAVEDGRVLVRVDLFERFTVTVGGLTVPDAAWSRRSAAALVKLLALAPGRRLHREQIIDAVWPDTPVDVAAPRLHKAAHYARRGLGTHRALLLVNDMATLLPDAEVVVDVLDFCTAAEEALRTGSEEHIRGALERYGGEPLPEDRYATWADDVRSRVSALHDELRARLAPAPAPAPAPSGRSNRGGPARLVGRRATGDLLRERMARTEEGDGGTVIVSGPAGVGKSAVLHGAVSIAARRGWQVGRGAASALESPWAYAPVLEAVTALCDSEPAGDSRTPAPSGSHDLRQVLEGARIGDDEAARGWLFPAVARLLLACSRRRPVLLAVDDVDEADLASVRLLHYLARRAAGHRVLLLLTHRAPVVGDAARLRDSLVSRDLAETVPLTPLSPVATGRLVTERFPGMSADRVAELVAASGGLPYTALQLGRFLSGDGLATPSPRLADAVLRSLQRATGLDDCFGATQLAAQAGISRADASRHLAVGDAVGILERTAAGHRFRHPLLREVLAALPVPTVEPAGHPPGARPAVIGWGARRPVCHLRHRSGAAGAVAAGPRRRVAAAV